MPHRPNRIDRHIQRAVRSILKSDRETQPRRQLPVQLTLRRSRAHSAYTKHVREVLRTNRIQHLTCERHALIRQIDEQLARHPQALVDIERAINIRIIDQSLPTHRRPRFLQITPHDNQQIILIFLLHLQQPIAVLQRGIGVVHAARPDDGEQAVFGVFVLDDIDGFGAGGNDGGFGGLGLPDFVLQEFGGDERVVAFDAPVFGGGGVAAGGVGDEELGVELALIVLEGTVGGAYRDAKAAWKRNYTYRHGEVLRGVVSVEVWDVATRKANSETPMQP